MTTQTYEGPVRGAWSPWGSVQVATPIADGIVFVSTSSHGGFWLSEARRERFFDLFPKWCPWTGTTEWMEEDADAPYVVAAFPHHFTDRDCAAAMVAIEANFRHGYGPSMFRYSDPDCAAKQLLEEKAARARE